MQDSPIDGWDILCKSYFWPVIGCIGRSAHRVAHSDSNAVSQHAEETGNIIASYQPCTLLYFVVNLMKELLNFGDKNAIVIYVYE